MMDRLDCPVMSARRLSRRFYRRDAVTVACDLLGQRLVRVNRGKRTAGIIVETEAYLGIEDRAAHTFGGRRTARNASMWGDGGHAYVYFTYGMHYCMNVVSGRVDQPLAVLIRALMPTEGVPIMRRRRGHADLCGGPARLTEAMAIDRALDGADLVAGRALFIERARFRPLAPAGILATPRIGIEYAGLWKNKPLRFVLLDTAQEHP